MWATAAETFSSSKTMRKFTIFFDFSLHRRNMIKCWSHYSFFKNRIKVYNLLLYIHRVQDIFMILIQLSNFRAIWKETVPPSSFYFTLARQLFDRVSMIKSQLSDQSKVNRIEVFPSVHPIYGSSLVFGIEKNP